MSIKAPAWCENAVPTANGWEDPITGELYSPQVLTEAPIGGKSLEEMTKVQLEALGRQHGIELDRRLHKETLIEQISDAIDK